MCFSVHLYGKLKSYFKYISKFIENISKHSRKCQQCAAQSSRGIKRRDEVNTMTKQTPYMKAQPHKQRTIARKAPLVTVKRKSTKNLKAPNSSKLDIFFIQVSIQFKNERLTEILQAVRCHIL